MTINQPTIQMKDFVNGNGVTYSDTFLDDNKNISFISNLDSVAQTVKNALQLWAGECEFNTTIGVPWATILGQLQNKLLLNSYLEDAILRIPYVVSIISIDYFPDSKNRTLSVNVKYLNTDNIVSTSNANI